LHIAQNLRHLFLRLAAVLACAALAACAGRGGPEALRAAASAAGAGKTVAIYVATTRQHDAQNAAVFNAGRAPQLSYARYVISLPPGHRPSQIEWPSAAGADPATSFALISTEPLTEAAFAASVSAAPKREDGRRLAGVFVHGYNNTFEESLFRMAQLVGDSGYGGAPVLFSWPSQGELKGYVADKEAATASRDHLAHVLDLLTALPGVDRVGLMGHSMGGWLTAEALRQLRLTHHDRTIARLLPVVLAAPDIDIDVFRSQVAVIGRLDPPLTVLVSKDDQALAVSARITSAEHRIGNLDVTDPRVIKAAADYHINVIDIAQLEKPDPSGHSRYIGAYKLLLEVARSAGRQPQGNPLRGAGAFVLDAVGAVVTPLTGASIADGEASFAEAAARGR
jgi:esterase/lipase superfamily enzyme